MTRRICTILFVLLLFVPIGISVFSFQEGQSTPLTPENLKTLTFAYPNGTAFSIDGNTEDATEQATIELLFALAAPAITEDSAYKRVGIPQAFADKSDYSTLTFVTDYYTRTYRLFVSTADPSIMTIAGVEVGSFSIPTDAAKAFLSNPLAQPYYTAPTLQAPTFCGVTLPLADSDLSIRTATGDSLSFTTQAEAPLSEPILCNKLELAFADNFNAPSQITVTLTEGSTTIFSQTGGLSAVSAAFSALHLPRGGDFTLTVTATYDEGAYTWFGTATWQAPVRLDVPPILTLSSTQISAGNPILLQLAKVQDPSTISIAFSAPLAGDFPQTLTVADLAVTAGGYSVLLPTDLALQNACTYQVTFCADGITWEPISFTVTPRAPLSEITLEENENFSMNYANGGEENYKSHIDTLGALYKNDLCTDYLSSAAPTELLSPIDTRGDFMKITSPGQLLTIIHTSGTPYTFTHTTQGTWYLTAITDIRLRNVYAVADGVVVGVGETVYGGLYIVVDHGGGLCSTYLHLSATETGLTTGTPVSAGDVIGVCGTSGMTRTDNNRVNVEVIYTIRGIPCLPFSTK